MRLWRIALAITIAWALTTTVLSAYFYQEVKRMTKLCNELKSEYEEKLILVDIVINYGNGTIKWYNDTVLLRGSTAFDAVRRIADVNWTKGAYGVFIIAIDDVYGNATHGWVFAIYGRKETSWGSTTKVDGWYYPGVSVDKVVLKNNDIIGFLYYNWAKKGWPPPPPTSK
ncbi:MAG: hypothetical protein DRZ82_08760 [Thermoprotei archaeon]|nr:MAG: hypothetical protein DRZ82_08760 [Thermoprotei archaeon]